MNILAMLALAASLAVGALFAPAYAMESQAQVSAAELAALGLPLAETSRRKTLTHVGDGQSSLNLNVRTGDGVETGSLIDNLTVDLIEVGLGNGLFQTYAVFNFHVYNDSWNHETDTPMWVNLHGNGDTLLFADAVDPIYVGRTGCFYPNGHNLHYVRPVDMVSVFDVVASYSLNVPLISGPIGSC